MNHPKTRVATWKGFETFDTTVWVPAPYLRYNPNMHHVDDNTKIIVDDSSREVTNIAVDSQEDGFELKLFHALKVSGSHVDEAEIVASWHFDSLDHLEHMIRVIKESVAKHK